MGDKHDHMVLLIVGIVAVIAIILMFIASREIPQQRVAPVYESSGTPLTGMVTIERRPSVVNYALTSYEGNYDYNGDNKITRQDSFILEEAIELGVCPSMRDCDLNNDGRVDIDDLAVMNANVLRKEAEAKTLLTGSAVKEPEVNAWYDDGVRSLSLATKLA